jgi:hypothetical protein
MDIDKLISEYKLFLENYDKGEMFKIRNTMRQLSNMIVSKLSTCKSNMTAEESNEFNEEMNKLNDNYNLNKSVYERLIDSYFKYTKIYVPSMIDLLHDDKFNKFDPEIYRDVLKTYIYYKNGDTSVLNKVNDYVKKSII